MDAAMTVAMPTNMLRRVGDLMCVPLWFGWPDEDRPEVLQKIRYRSARTDLRCGARSALIDMRREPVTDPRSERLGRRYENLRQGLNAGCTKNLRAGSIGDDDRGSVANEERLGLLRLTGNIDFAHGRPGDQPLSLGEHRSRLHARLAE